MLHGIRGTYTTTLNQQCSPMIQRTHPILMHIFCNTIYFSAYVDTLEYVTPNRMKIRVALVAAVFSKSLRLRSISNNDSMNDDISLGSSSSKKMRSKKKESISSTSSGQIMNLVSNDAERFLIVTLFMSYLIWSPVQAISTLIVGTYIIGPAFTVGVGILLFLFVPLQMFLSKRFAALRLKVIVFMY